MTKLRSSKPRRVIPQRPRRARADLFRGSLVFLVVVTLFIGELTAVAIGRWVAGLFMTAMLLITAGLVSLLVEIGIAAGQVSENPEV